MGPWLGELFRFDVYKRTQGRVTRQVTFGAIALVAVLGAWRLGRSLIDYGPTGTYGVPLVLAVVGCWLAFRAVNVPRFADFLISVEAEMSKVSWPTRDVLFRSSAVVMFVIFSLAAILFLYDMIWSQLLGLLGISG